MKWLKSKLEKSIQIQYYAEQTKFQGNWTNHKWDCRVKVARSTCGDCPFDDKADAVSFSFNSIVLAWSNLSRLSFFYHFDDLLSIEFCAKAVRGRGKCWKSSKEHKKARPKANNKQKNKRKMMMEKSLLVIWPRTMEIQGFIEKVHVYLVASTPFQCCPQKRINNSLSDAVYFVSL